MKKLLSFGCLLPVVSLLSLPVMADDSIWGGGDGNWSDNNWINAGGADTSFIPGNRAVINDACTITVTSDTDAVAGLLFTADATIDGPGKLVIDSASAAKTIEVASGVAAKISAPIDGKVRKTGYGSLETTADNYKTLTLGDNKVDPVVFELYTGTWVVSGGSTVHVQTPSSTEGESGWYYFQGEGGSYSDPTKGAYIVVTNHSTLMYSKGKSAPWTCFGPRNKKGHFELLITDGSTFKTKSDDFRISSEQGAASDSYFKMRAENSTVEIQSTLNGNSRNSNATKIVEFVDSDVTFTKIQMKGPASRNSVTFDGATVHTRSDQNPFFDASERNNSVIYHTTGNGLTIDAAHEITIAADAILDGTGGLTKTGAKKLTMPAANLYTGTTKAAAGELDLSGSVAGPLEVSSGATLNVSSTTQGAVPSITVNGTAVFANVPVKTQSLVFGNGGVLDIGANYGHEIGTASGYANATLSFDASGWPVNTALFTSQDADFLAWLKTKLEASGTAYDVVIDGSSVKFALAGAAYTFDSTTVTDMNDPDGWQGGVVPPVGSDVVVLGSGVTATLSSTTPSFNSILVSGGATLRLAASPGATALTFSAGTTFIIASGYSHTLSASPGCDAVILEAGSALVVPPNATVEFPATVAGVAPVGNESLASLTVRENATIQVPGGFAFKNVDLTLEEATVEATSVGPITFGTAAAGETAFFTMTATDATVTTVEDPLGNTNSSMIRFATPAAGGTVLVPDDIVLTRTTLTYNRINGFDFGTGNPESEPFAVVLDATDLKNGWTTTVGGACTLRLTNGSVCSRWRHGEGDGETQNYNLVVADKGVIELVDGGEIRSGVSRINGNLTDATIRLQPSETGWASIRVLDDGIGCWYKLNGYNLGSVVVSNGVFELFKGYWWGWGNRAHPFNKLTAIEIPEGATMTLKGVADKFSTNAKRLDCVDIESPFTGAGDLVVTNAITSGSDYGSTTLQPVIWHNDNTCTGSLTVEDSERYASLLHIVDGANWAGIVNWQSNRMDITWEYPTKGQNAGNKPSLKATATEVSLGGVNLETDFAIRVWEDGSADKVNLGEFGWTGTERIALEAQDFAMFTAGRWHIGTIPATGVVLPRVRNPGLRLVALPIEGGDGTRMDVWVTVANGTTVLLR